MSQDWFTRAGRNQGWRWKSGDVHFQDRQGGSDPDSGLNKPPGHRTGPGSRLTTAPQLPHPDPRLPRKALIRHQVDSALGAAAPPFPCAVHAVVLGVNSLSLHLELLITHARAGNGPFFAA
jgi:hypothetical protein